MKQQKECAFDKIAHEEKIEVRDDYQELSQPW